MLEASQLSTRSGWVREQLESIQSGMVQIIPSREVSCNGVVVEGGD